VVTSEVTTLVTALHYPTLACAYAWALALPLARISACARGIYNLTVRKNTCTLDSMNKNQFEEEFDRLTDEIRQQLSSGKQSAAYSAHRRLGHHIRENWKLITNGRVAWNGQEAEETAAERREGVEE
jgi:hypothetical protein